MMRVSRFCRAWVAGRAAVLLVAAVGVMACDDGVEVPPLAGPSGLGLSIEMEANPAFVNADGASTSTITIAGRDSRGRPVVGKPLFVAHDGDGLLYPAGGGLGGLQTGISVATAGGGVARVVYRSGTAADRLVTIRCEPYSGDAGFTGEVPRSVVIHQR